MRNLETKDISRCQIPFWDAEIWHPTNTVTNHRAPQLSEANRSISGSPQCPSEWLVGIGSLQNDTPRHHTLLTSFDAFHPRHHRKKVVHDSSRVRIIFVPQQNNNQFIAFAPTMPLLNIIPSTPAASHRPAIGGSLAQQHVKPSCQSQVQSNATVTVVALAM